MGRYHQYHKNKLPSRIVEGLARKAILKTLMQLNGGNNFGYSHNTLAQNTANDEIYGSISPKDVAELLAPCVASKKVIKVNIESFHGQVYSGFLLNSKNHSQPILSTIDEALVLSTYEKEVLQHLRELRIKNNGIYYNSTYLAYLTRINDQLHVLNSSEATTILESLVGFGLVSKVTIHAPQKPTVGYAAIQLGIKKK